MDLLFQISSVMWVDAFFGHVTLFLASLLDWDSFLSAEGGITVALALGAVADIPESVRARIRQWHGSIDQQFDNINSLVNRVEAHQAAWAMPAALLSQLTAARDQLQALIFKCRSSDGSPADRTVRSALLKATVGLCLTRVRSWAYAEHYAGVLTVEDVHLLGFLLPGEVGGSRARHEATDVLAEIKVSIINADFIHAVIDQASGENAALVVHGWPKGVRHALIVILAADGMTEVYRQIITRLHNDIQMPEGSRGKQFIIKAAFLKHVNDAPKFGAQPTFSMPLTTEDLAATLDRQHHEDFEAQVRETERHRQEVERLQAELNKQK